jgi:hypothetical protein
MQRLNHGPLTRPRITGRLGMLVLLSLAFNTVTADELQLSGTQPAAYRAEYLAKTSGLSATAYRTLERLDEQRYRLSNNMRVTVLRATLGSVSESSEFTLQNGLVRPTRYIYDQTGPGKRFEHITFDWENAKAETRTNKKTEHVTLAEGVMDQLSFTAQLSLDLAAVPVDQLFDARSFLYQIVDGDEIDEHRYDVTGMEIVTTPAGAMSTVRLERVRSSASSRSTVFWLAVDQAFMLVKLEQRSRSGDSTDLLLQSFTEL